MMTANTYEYLKYCMLCEFQTAPKLKYTDCSRKVNHQSYRNILDALIKDNQSRMKKINKFKSSKQNHRQSLINIYSNRQSKQSNFLTSFYLTQLQTDTQQVRYSDQVASTYPNRNTNEDDKCFTNSIPSERGNLSIDKQMVLEEKVQANLENYIYILQESLSRFSLEITRLTNSLQNKEIGDNESQGILQDAKMQLFSCRSHKSAAKSYLKCAKLKLERHLNNRKMHLSNSARANNYYLEMIAANALKLKKYNKQLAEQKYQLSILTKHSKYLQAQYQSQKQMARFLEYICYAYVYLKNEDCGYNYNDRYKDYLKMIETMENTIKSYYEKVVYSIERLYQSYMLQIEEKYSLIRLMNTFTQDTQVAPKTLNNKSNMILTASTSQCYQKSAKINRISSQLYDLCSNLHCINSTLLDQLQDTSSKYLKTNKYTKQRMYNLMNSFKAIHIPSNNTKIPQSILSKHLNENFYNSDIFYYYLTSICHDKLIRSNLTEKYYMKQLKRIKKTKKGHKTLPTIYFFWISLTELLKQAHSYQLKTFNELITVFRAIINFTSTKEYKDVSSSRITINLAITSTNCSVKKLGHTKSTNEEDPAPKRGKLAKNKLKTYSIELTVHDYKKHVVEYVTLQKIRAMKQQAKQSKFALTDFKNYYSEYQQYLEQMVHS